MAEGDRGGRGRENHAQLSGCPGPHQFRRGARPFWRSAELPLHTLWRHRDSIAGPVLLRGLRHMQALMQREQAGADAIGAELVLMER